MPAESRAGSAGRGGPVARKDAMPTPPTKTQRWLDLLAFLSGRRYPVTVEQIVEGVPAYAPGRTGTEDTARASTRRMFERDKDELRAFGIPIETIRFTTSHGLDETIGYRLASRDFYLPYLRLIRSEGGGAASSDGPSSGAGVGHRPAESFEIVEADAALAVLGLRRLAGVPGFPLVREARSALRKLTFDLDPEGMADVPVRYVRPPGTEQVEGTLRALSDGLLARKTVDFHYRGMSRGDVTERTVRPFGLLYQHAHWYLIGHDEGRAGIRVFRAGRMERVQVNRRRAGSPDFEIPEDFDMGRFASRDPWDLGGEEGQPPIEARIRFAFPRSLWAARNDMGVLAEEHPDGSSSRTFRLLQPEPFVRWILSLEGDAVVESPESLRDAVQEVADRLLALYHEDAPGA